MRTKLFGAFIGALAITAFAALPSMASAQNVTLKEGNLTVPAGETIRATSTDFLFTGRPSGLSVACDKTSIRGLVRTNPGVRVTFRSGGVFQNAGGGDRCKVEPTSGRLRARVENVTFRKDINLTKNAAGVVTGRTEVRFTLRLFHLALEPNGPIASCSYDGTLEVTGEVGKDEIHVQSEEDALLETEISSESCDPEEFLVGDFRLTRRDGTSVVKF
jgi:hypothetical protein